MRYKGLDLPVFNGSTPLVWNKTELYGIDMVNPEARFLRRVDWVKPVGMSFSCFLKLADVELAHVATACGAEVVDFRWALYDHTDVREVSLNLELPPNHTLVADVAIVEVHPDPPAKLKTRFMDGRFDYHQEGIDAHRPFIGDTLFEVQGVFGVQRSHEGPPCYKWVDIEPILVTNPL